MSFLITARPCVRNRFVLCVSASLRLCVTLPESLRPLRLCGETVLGSWFYGPSSGPVGASWAVGAGAPQRAQKRAPSRSSARQSGQRGAP